MRHARQIAITEVWLDQQAAASAKVPLVVRGWDWPGLVGQGLAVVGIILLIVESIGRMR